MDENGRSDAARLRVLVVHGRYRSAGPSGENEVVDDEVRLLREHGCTVEQLELASDEIADWPAWKRATLPGRVIWSRAGQRALERAVERYRPAVIHIHNTFPLFSPAVFWQARRSGAAVVHTLHNFRPFCPAGTFLRDGRACEACLGRFPLPAIRYGCYRDSRVATIPVALMDGVHGWLRTWQRCVDRFIVVSDYERDKYVQGGWPADKIRVKYNTVWEQALPPRRPGPAFVCMSRLSPEKGVDVFLEGWRRAFPQGGPPVRLTASGPLGAELRAEYGDLPGVTFLGTSSAACSSTSSPERGRSCCRRAATRDSPAWWWKRTQPGCPWSRRVSAASPSSWSTTSPGCRCGRETRTTWRRRCGGWRSRTSSSSGWAAPRANATSASTARR